MQASLVQRSGDAALAVTFDAGVSLGAAAREIAEAYRQAQNDDFSPHLRSHAGGIVVEKCTGVPEIIITAGKQAGVSAEFVAGDASLLERVEAKLLKPDRGGASFGHP